MIAYVDTSALVKLLVSEAGSDATIESVDSAEQHATSLVTYVEARAALSSAQRSRRISPRDLDGARSSLDRRWATFVHIDIDGKLIKAAGDLAERQRLRGYDAVHLASALTLRETGEVTVITWDEDLARAARSSGLPTAPAMR